MVGFFECVNENNISIKFYDVIHFMENKYNIYNTLITSYLMLKVRHINVILASEVRKLRQKNKRISDVVYDVGLNNENNGLIKYVITSD